MARWAAIFLLRGATPTPLSPARGVRGAMGSGQDSVPTSAPSQRAVFPPSPRPRAPEHELRDRAKAAKLRHKAARARVKANRLQDRSRYLFQKATTMERRADDLDGIVRTPVPESINPRVSVGRAPARRGSQGPRSRAP